MKSFIFLLLASVFAVSMSGALFLSSKVTMPFRMERLSNDKKIQTWIADLNHEDFDRREEATQHLIESGTTRTPSLLSILQATPDYEVQARLKRVLSRIESQVGRKKINDIKLKQRVLRVEQSCVFVSSDKAVRKATTQIIHFASDWIRIEDYNSGASIPVEIQHMDFRNKKIIRCVQVVDRMRREIITFEHRRMKIEAFKMALIKKHEALTKKTEKEDFKRIYRGYLDRSLELITVLGQPINRLKLAGVMTDLVLFVNEEDASHIPFKVWLHPKVPLPAHSTELFYLLGLIGEKTSAYLKRDFISFRRLPLRMEFEVATGGILSVHVRKFKWIETSMGSEMSAFRERDEWDDIKNLLPPPLNQSQR